MQPKKGLAPLPAPRVAQHWEGCKGAITSLPYPNKSETGEKINKVLQIGLRRKEL